ncbi:MAG: aminoglycoside phosphotransferase family protein [Meiothermus sp.]|uniref:phosphotransferase family protein n=1 Tax=Meiothermus sp. TaxID=1955249 RepID=UPI0025EF7249|nr:aminoglycoside phosphotransferase family protein [Meiothermus sp.]MCS7067790.1 aminoglycoside phosphotransferase family protein [Meiothermus sp.]MCX7601209.1 aminoglycoside phosphotransferase family protein [Meiothermus sp.]MDW8425255.1 aminoglycoside phosphotransferase family protein [Meiothermus sp.]
MLCKVEILPALEARYQMPLTPLVGGAEARTFAGDGLVFKVYPPQTTEPGGIYAARLEALNMTKAGLAEWVVEAYTLNQHGILVTRRYPGTNFTPTRFSQAALNELARFFVHLHSIAEPGVVSRSRLQNRLNQFGGTLHDLPQAQQLVGWLWQHIDEVAGTPQAFCHRDPHAGNILLKHPEAQGVPEALVVDWVRAQPDDPARDLAILTTGTLVLLGEEKATAALQSIVQSYPEPTLLWRRLRFWVPLTYLHDMHWFRTKEPAGFEAAVADKMPKALRFYQDFNPELA